MISEQESNFLNDKPSKTNIEKDNWRGIPGVDYQHISLVRKDRISRLLGADGTAVTTEKFQWNRFSETVMDRVRKAKETANVNRVKALIENSNDEVNDASSDQALKAAITEARYVIDNEVADTNIFSNTLKKYQDRLEIITSEIPDVFKNVNGANGAEMYFLVQSGTREENDQQIFEQFRNWNNTSGETHMEHLYYNWNGLLTGHGDNNFFGWKVTVDGYSFVFIWNPDESDINQKPEERSEINENDDDTANKDVTQK